MASDFRVTGADDIARASKALRDAGDKAGRTEMLKAIRTSTEQVRKDMRLSAFGELPKRGRLNVAVASSRFTVKTKAGTTARGVGVTLTVGSGKQVRDVRAVDQGRLRHPTFGHSPWVTQMIQPGVFTNEFERAAPGIRREISKAMERVVQDIARRSR